MQRAQVVQNLDYGHLVKTEDDEQIFLDSKSTYLVNSTVNIIKLGEKAVDYCVVEKGLQEGFVLAEYANGKLTCADKEIIALAPPSLKKYTVVHVVKMNDFFVGRILMNGGDLCQSSKSSKIKEIIKLININQLSYYKHSDIDVSKATPLAKFTKFCNEFNLSCMVHNDMPFFVNKDFNPSHPTHSHDKPYGLLIDNTQFHKYSDICRGTQTTFKVTEVCLDKKKRIGYWCLIGAFKSFLPNHLNPHKSIKLGSIHNGTVWDIQQDTVVLSLHPNTATNSSTPVFPTLASVKEHLLSNQECEAVIRQIDKHRVQCDYYGIRGWVESTGKIGSFINCSVDGSLSNIHFKNQFGIIKAPITYDNTPFTKDIVPCESKVALYGPPLIIKPLILQVQHSFEIGCTVPFWIHSIDKNCLYLHSWHNNKLIKAVAFKSNIADYFVVDLSIFKIGSTVLGVLMEENEHGYIVSLKWKSIQQSISKHGFNSHPSIVLSKDGIPHHVATLVRHLDRSHVGLTVDCTLINTTATGLLVQFTLGNKEVICKGFIATSDIIESKSFKAMIIHHNSALYDLTLVDAKRPHSSTCKIVLLTNEYAIGLLDHKVGYIPLRNMNTPIQHGLQLNQTIQVVASVVGDVPIYTPAIIKHKQNTAILNTVVHGAVVTHVLKHQINFKYQHQHGRILLQHYNKVQVGDSISIYIVDQRKGLLEGIAVNHPNIPLYSNIDHKPILDTGYHCIVQQVNKDHCLVQLIPGLRAVLYDIGCDDFKQMKENMVLNVTLSYVKNDKYYCTMTHKKILRIVSCNAIEYQVILQTGQTALLSKLKYPTMQVGDVMPWESTREYKNRLIVNPYDPSSVEVGSIVNGIIINNNHGLYIQIGTTMIAKVMIRDVSDDYVKLTDYTVGLMCKCKITSIQNDLIQASMKNSDVLGIDYYALIEVGQVLKATIVHKKGNNKVYLKSENGVKMMADAAIQGSVKDVVQVQITAKQNKKITCQIYNKEVDEMVVDDDSSSVVDEDQQDANSEISLVEESDVLHESTNAAIAAPIVAFIKSDELEKLIMEEPNNSIHWITYMGYALQQDLTFGRMIGQRALKTIYYRDEVERRNVTIAMLNMEMEMGTLSDFNRQLAEVLLVNDQKSILLHCLEIATKQHKTEICDLLIKKLMKSTEFKSSCKVWLKIIGYYFSVDDHLELARATLHKSLLSLEKHKHVKIIQKYGVLEYTMGDKERARTIFEGIITSHPKRLDLWSIWVDLEIKHNEIENARGLFERMLTRMDGKAKQGKFIFEKFLKFEEKHGNAQQVNDVKAKALEYVKGLNENK